MNSLSELKFNNNTVPSIINKVTLTSRERKGFLFEGEVSEILFKLKVLHNEFPHLFSKDFKKNIAQGVDFRFSIGQHEVRIECKDWKYAYRFWLPNVYNRFKGTENNGHYNLCVVKNKHSSGFFKLRHILKEHGIILLDIDELSSFLRKLMGRGINIINNLSFNYNKLSFVNDVFTTNLQRPKEYSKQFLISLSGFNRFKNLVDNSMLKIINKVLPKQYFLKNSARAELLDISTGLLARASKKNIMRGE